MRLTPADVHNVAFKKPSIGKRGYDEDEVDAFLDLVEAELSRLIEENNELTQRLAAADSSHSGAGQGAVTLDKSAGSGTDDAGDQSSSAAGQPAGGPAPSAVAGKAAGDQADRVDPQAATAQQTAPQPKAPGAPADHHVHAARLLGLAEETAQRLTSEAQAEADSTLLSARSEAEKLVSDAKSQSQSMMSDAKNRSETMVSDAKNQSESMVSDAKNRSQQMVTEATARAQALTRDSQLKAEAIDREAQRKYTEVMTQLTEQRTALEKKIDDLRIYEREYRNRLKGWITEQLAQLDEGGKSATVTGGAATSSTSNSAG